MNFSEWLISQSKHDQDVDEFLKDAVMDKSWPYDGTDLKTFVHHLKTQGASIDSCGNLLKFWAKYLKVMSGMRPIMASEIREIREVLVGMLSWVRTNSGNLDVMEEQALREAEQQVACLEEKEVELRYLMIRLQDGF